MTRFIWTFAILALITSCKSQTAVAPLVIRDSISITYKQGVEQPSPSGLRGAQTDFRRNSSAPAFGKVGLGATREASVSEEALSERTNKPAVPPTTIRVDTVFIERWHTEVCQPQAVCQRSGPSAEGGLSAKRSQFYKNCTLGFWILLIVFLGSFGFRILKAIYLKR